MFYLLCFIFFCCYVYHVYYSFHFQKKSLYYILDTFFTVAVVHTTAISLWRGLWGIMDAELFPDQLPVSAWITLLIGYGVMFAAGCVQYPASIISSDASGRHPVLSIIFEQLYYLITSVCPICVWRGFWILCDVFVMPDNPIVGKAIIHCVGIFTLMLLGCGKCVQVTGCFVDGSQPNGEGVLLPINRLASLDMLLVPTESNGVSRDNDHVTKSVLTTERVSVV